ncbi:hypothetical protein SteCoe_25403 [Stentor coeruleus]|uniref:C2H2-type domain-containing protein n=1 Tax=Stentor coeruleus TaxID=5963 RepID=A0A1R2BF81_9CILI|nr:hypothetical protein SteCoe_25403 [Stentor coeruleus]
MDKDKEKFPASALPAPHLPKTCERTKTDQKYYSCVYCTLSFKKHQDFLLHSDTKASEIPALESPKTSKVQCPDCISEFSTYKGMRQHHGKIHQIERKVKCKLCSKKFKDNYAVKFHKRQVHEKSTQKTCFFCIKTFYNKYSYKMHFDKCPNRVFDDSIAGNNRDKD